MNKMDFTSKLEWKNFDKEIVLTKTNGKTLILKEGQYIKFIRTFTYYFIPSHWTYTSSWSFCCQIILGI